jgi:hypothetical protein
MAVFAPTDVLYHHLKHGWVNSVGKILAR